MIKQKSFSLYILLSIITCGIYSLIFWYTFTEELNYMCGNDTKPLPNFFLVIFLSFITCGIYPLFWYYNMGDKLQRSCQNRGIFVSESGSTILLWMIIGSFLCGIGPFVAIYILIKNFNLIAENHNFNCYNNNMNNMNNINNMNNMM